MRRQRFNRRKPRPRPIRRDTSHLGIWIAGIPLVVSFLIMLLSMVFRFYERWKRNRRYKEAGLARRRSGSVLLIVLMWTAVGFVVILVEVPVSSLIWSNRYDNTSYAGGVPASMVVLMISVRIGICFRCDSCFAFGVVASVKTMD